MLCQSAHDPRQHLQEGVLDEQDLPLQGHHVQLHLPLVGVGLDVDGVIGSQFNVGEMEVCHHLLNCLQ